MFCRTVSQDEGAFNNLAKARTPTKLRHDPAAVTLIFVIGST
jgi:hypothetical protein